MKKATSRIPSLPHPVLLAGFLFLACTPSIQAQLRDYGYSDGHTSGANCAFFLKDGKRVVTASNDTTVKLWDLASGLVLRTFSGADAPIYDIAMVDNDNSVLAYTSKGRIILWSLATGAIIGDYTGRKRIFDVSADGKLALSMRQADGWELELWNVLTGQTIQRYRGHSDLITKAFFMQDGKRIISTSADASLRIWDRQSGQERKKLNFLTGLGAIAISPDEMEIIVGTNAPELIICSLQQGATTNVDSYSPTSSRANLHNSDMQGIWYIDASTILSIDQKAGSDDNILLWDSNNGTILKSWGNPKAWAAVSPDRRLMTTNAHESEGCPIIDLRSGQVIQILAANWEP